MISIVAVFSAVGLLAIAFETVHINKQVVCDTKKWSPKCHPGSVIVIEKSTYGRMYLDGNCAKSERYPKGCKVDTLSITEEKCGGRRSCTISVPDNNFRELSSCESDLMQFLEIFWVCQNVTGSEYTCNGQKLLLTSDTGHLSSFEAQESGVGSSSCPWLIQASPGQRIRVWVNDYSHGRPLGPSNCIRYATITESRFNRNETSICRRNKRRYLAYTSKKNSITITLSNQHDDPDSYFTLEYEVYGCPTPPERKNTRQIREGNILTIRCAYGGSSWVLECNGTNWLGTVGNCSENKPETFYENPQQLPKGIWVAIIIGAGIIVSALVLITGLMCLNRRRRLKYVADTKNAPYMQAFGDHAQVQTIEEDANRSMLRSRPVPVPTVPLDGLYSNRDSEHRCSSNLENAENCYGFRTIPPSASNMPVSPSNGFATLYGRVRPTRQWRSPAVLYFTLDPSGPSQATTLTDPQPDVVPPRRTAEDDDCWMTTIDERDENSINDAVDASVNLATVKTKANVKGKSSPLAKI